MLAAHTHWTALKIPATIDGMPSPSPTAASAKIFISYKRNVEPDQTLAAGVFEALQQQGHSVFIDRTMTVGQPWAKEIETKVRNSDCLIVFLTAQSSQSEMVRGEIDIARDQAAKTVGTPRTLPSGWPMPDPFRIP